MTRLGWFGAALVFAAVGTAYVLVMSWSSPPAAEEGLRSYLTTMGVIASPAAVAGVLLWRAWWLSTGARLSRLDGPARLLAAAVATLPAGRREWGAAMVAELARLAGRRQRWRFAAGCAVAALAVPRGWRPHRPAAGLPIALTGLAGVALCAAVAGYHLGTGAVPRLAPFDAAVGIVLLAAGLWLALAPPRALTTSRRARRAGLALGVALAAGMLLAAHTVGIGLYVLGVPAFAVFLAAFLVALADHRFRAGMQAAVWTLVAACPLSFAVYVVEALRYRRAGIHPIDGDPVTGPGGAELREAVGWVLVHMPMWALPLAVFGAALGAAGAAGPKVPAGTPPAATPPACM